MNLILRYIIPVHIYFFNPIIYFCLPITKWKLLFPKWQQFLILGSRTVRKHEVIYFSTFLTAVQALLYYISCLNHCNHLKKALSPCTTKPLEVQIWPVIPHPEQNRLSFLGCHITPSLVSAQNIKNNCSYY